MAALIDLPLILNLSEQIPALRRVRALDQLLMQDLPPLGGGTTLAATLHLCDGEGDILEESGAVAQSPVLVISRFGDDGQEMLALVTSFTRITGDPKGWSFSLPLTAQELADYLGTDGESKEAVFEVSMAAAGLLKPLYRRAVTLLPWFSDGTAPVPTPSAALRSPVLRADITSGALLRAVVTVGRVMPTMFLTLEGGAWTGWTFRARVDGEVDDDINYRVPDDWDADDNNGIWVRSSIV